MSSDFIASFSICGIYQVTHFLGKGVSGKVWKAFEFLTGQQVAIKTKQIDATHVLPAIIVYEAKIYRLLEDVEGIPSIHWCGVDGNHYVIVMDLLGPDLDCLRRFCRGQFSLRTVCMLAEQMLHRLEVIHGRGIVSCDVKPHNFAMGSEESGRIVHLFDFSHAQMFLNPLTGEHIPFREERNGFGTPKYASIAAHLWHEVSRRDDLESLLYVLLELYHGFLPWGDVQVHTDGTNLQFIQDMKQGEAFEQYLAQSLPEFREYHTYLAGLSFGQAPDYLYLKQIFRKRMQTEGWSDDRKFDWEDASYLGGGTLMPEEYKFSSEYVERFALDPR